MYREKEEAKSKPAGLLLVNISAQGYVLGGFTLWIFLRSIFGAAVLPVSFSSSY